MPNNKKIRKHEKCTNIMLNWFHGGPTRTYHKLPHTISHKQTVRSTFSVWVAFQIVNYSPFSDWFLWRWFLTFSFTLAYVWDHTNPIVWYELVRDRFRGLDKKMGTDKHTWKCNRTILTIPYISLRGFQPKWTLPPTT